MPRRAYEIGLDNTSPSPDAEPTKTHAGPPWRESMVNGYFNDGRWTITAIALGDFYTVGLYVSRADPNCAPDDAELVQMIAEEFMPAPHTSIEEHIASGR